MTDDERWMREAIAAARRGIESGQTPFGACIVGSGGIVAAAHNTVWAATDSTAHAEVNAIRDACLRLGRIDLSGCAIYSTCEPCPMCFSACHWARLDRIVFGASIEDAARAGFRELPVANAWLKEASGSPVLLEGAILAGECAGLFGEWKASSSPKAY